MDSQDCFFVSRLTGHLWGGGSTCTLCFGGVYLKGTVMIRGRCQEVTSFPLDMVDGWCHLKRCPGACILMINSQVGFS